MEWARKYRETIVFASCVVAFVGAVLVMQKLTTPAPPPRRAGSSSAGVAMRSRTGSRNRGHSGIPSRRSKSHESSRLHRSHREDGALSHPATGDVVMQPLTVDAINQHRANLAATNQAPPPLDRKTSSSPYDEALRQSAAPVVPPHRTASNAATAGSQPPLSSSRHFSDAAEAASMSSQLPVLPTKARSSDALSDLLAPSRPPLPEKKSAPLFASRRVGVAACQTNHHTFTAEVATQTEAAAVPSISALTPERELQFLSPIPHEFAGRSRTPYTTNDLALSPAQKRLTVAAKRETHPFPLHLIHQMEKQLGSLLEAAYDESAAVGRWMAVYFYLMELPSAAVQVLARRGKCGAGTLQMLCMIDKTPHKVDSSSGVESPAHGMLERLLAEVESLLVKGVPLEPEQHFEWDNETVRLSGGAYQQSGRTSAEPKPPPPPEQIEAVRIVDSSDSEEDEGGQVPEVHQVLGHLRRHRFLVMRNAATQCSAALSGNEQRQGILLPPEAGEELVTPQRGILMEENSNRQLGVQSRRHPGGSTSPETAPLPVAATISLLSSLLALKSSGEFREMRRSSQQAVFACDFLELASDAERLLDQFVAAGEPSTQIIHAVSERHNGASAVQSGAKVDRQAAFCDDGTTPSLQRRRHRRNTPMKPSIRSSTSLQIVSTPLSAGQTVREDNINVFDRLYTPPQSFFKAR